MKFTQNNKNIITTFIGASLGSIITTDNLNIINTILKMTYGVRLFSLDFLYSPYKLPFRHFSIK